MDTSDNIHKSQMRSLMKEIHSYKIKKAVNDFKEVQFVVSDLYKDTPEEALLKYNYRSLLCAKIIEEDIKYRHSS